MALKLITPPAEEPVTLQEAKNHLRIAHAELDTMITNLITSAREDCEGFQNRQYITATYQLWLDAWPCEDHIRIPRPPLQSIASVKYYGTDNTEYTFDPENYFVDDKNEPGRVALAYSKIWPTATLRPANAVVVEFVAGYGEAADVPQKVKQAILLKIELDFDKHEPDYAKKIQEAIDRLLWKDRVVNV